MKRKLLLRIAALGCCCISMVLSGCTSAASKTDLGVVHLPYYDQAGKEGVNADLFYRNDLDTPGADPGVLAVTEGEEEGWFYQYNTYGTGARGIYCMKSKDLSSWEFADVCYSPDIKSWGITDIWAPKAIYDESDGKYYLFYCATNTNQEAGYLNVKYMGVAVSDSPNGPFVQYTGTNGDGREIGIGDPIFNPALIPESHELYERYKNGNSFIDPNPFIDPVTGDKYLYMCRNREAGEETNVICGVKMKDWATPDYSTFQELTKVGKTTVDGNESMDKEEGIINEAPDILYHDGTYYLTYSINETKNKDYTIMQALSDKPLGPFTKVQEADGGVVVGPEMIWDHISCTGSHSFVYAGDELFVVYHQNVNREFGGDMNRALAVERVGFAENMLGQKVLKAIGPTWSVQPKPATFTGYKNMAAEAKITAKNMVEDSDVSYLNDGLVRMHEIDCVEQFYGKNTVTITMDYDEYITAKSLLIYNSYYYEDAFYQIDQIDFAFRKEVDGKMSTGIARIEDVYYDFETYANIDYSIMRPGAPLVLEFEELEINQVTITLTCPDGQDVLGISEIMLLGKEIK